MNTTRFATSPIAAAAAACALTCALACALAVPTASFAGVKYWDNPDFRAFDVGDYVQDGLQVNYDGIRNQGPNAPHDFSASNWVNCAATGSTYDMTRYSLVSGAWTNNNATGSWTDTGFVFNKDAIFHEMTSITIQKTYTIQTLVNATGGEQSGIGYIMCDYNDNKDGFPKEHPGNWAGCCIGIRSSAGGGTPNNSFYLVSSQRPYFAASSATELFSYATAIHNHSEGVIFAGTKAPWNATDGSYRSDLSDAAYVRDWGISLGGHYPRTDEHLKGTLKNFRLYSKCLSDEEVAWNRVVDEARYFHRRAAIPVTNVVVAATNLGIEDDHFALDSEGYTFTAPAQRTVNGKRYVLGGYTLETWNGSAWDAPVSHSGKSSCALTDTSAKVRLTWLYSRPADEGQLAHYDVSDYEPGALLHFDGIFNQGSDKEHDPVASTWKNLGSEDFDLTLKNSPGTVLARPVDASYWSDDGFVYAGTVRFGNDTARTWGPDYTIQVLVDATRASQKEKSGQNYIFATAWNKCALSYYGSASRGLELHTQGAPSGSAHYGPYLPTESLTYATATLDSSNNSATVFTGTSVPSGAGLTYVTNFSSSVTSNNNGLNLGGFGGGGNTGANFLVGTIKNFRVYGRVLTQAELEQNRKVDEYRFFGRYVVTNVLVQSTYSYLEGYDKCGPYEVDGSYTFVAPATNTAPNGITYACDGYTVETMDANGNWGTADSYSGTTYTATDSGTVRLTWRWRATSGLRSVANYGFEDYATGGLKVHLDGLFNAGVDVSPRTTANTTGTKWVNLGSNGTTSDASLTKGSDSSAWTDDGYYFDGKSKFVIANIGVKTNSSYTIQLLSDVDRSLLRLDSEGKAQHNYLFSGVYNLLAVSVYGQGKPYLRAGTDFSFSLAEGEHLTYFTGMMDRSETPPVAYAFPGTTPASGATSRDSKLTTPTANNPNLGGWGGTSASQLTQYLIGTIKSFRYYDRVLTEEELVRNRQVDSARYFSALAVTNVFVAVDADSTGITPAETADTAYFVEGSHTFRATGGAGLGYRLAYLDGNEWQPLQSFTDGGSYTYTAGTSPATVKLEWRVQKPFTMIVR